VKFVALATALAAPRQKEPDGRKVKIYALVDPRDDRVRYVGKTRKTLPARLALHLESPTNRSMAAWFAELARALLAPAPVVLEFVSDDEWQAAERGWIHWFRERGQLLNIDPGGDHRDRTGRARGTFVGTYVPPQPGAGRSGPEALRPVLRDGSLWDRLRHPMRAPSLEGKRTRKSTGGGARGQRRYITGDPGA
jgi:hypothetical protein